MSCIVASLTSQRPNFLIYTSRISTTAASFLKSCNRALPLLPFSACQFQLGWKKYRPFSWKCKKSFELYALSSYAQGNNWIRVEPERDESFVEEDEFVVVNFYHFVLIDDPEEEVSKHQSFMQVFACRYLFYTFHIFLICLCFAFFKI